MKFKELEKRAELLPTIVSLCLRDTNDLVVISIDRRGQITIQVDGDKYEQSIKDLRQMGAVLGTYGMHGDDWRTVKLGEIEFVIYG